MWEVLFAGVAVVAGWALRWLANQREWAQARRIARAELHSPDPATTNDPEVAMARGIVSVNRRRIKSQSRMLQRPGSVSDSNGHGHKTPHAGVRVVRDSDEGG